MALATERIEGSHQAHEVSHAKVYVWDSGWYIEIECACGERFVLTDAKTEAGAPGADHSTSAKEGFYSWLEDYPARLGGKEARQEYYARLEEEQAAAW